MMRLRIALLMLLVLVLAGCEKFRGEPASLDEITKVINALRASGGTAVSEIDVDSDGYEIEGAICEDGKRNDVKLDKKFAVISKRKDWI
jgi:Peptidase propeptide and YPEB domain